MSLSSKTITGALPPSSRCVRLRWPPALTATARPAATEQVIDTICGVGCATTAAPVFRSPQTAFSTPGGKWRDAISASITVVTGVAALGFNQRLGVFFYVIGEIEQRLLPVRRCRALPVGKCLGSGGVRVVDVLL